MDTDKSTRYAKEHGYHPGMLRFRNVEARFAVVVD